MPEFISILKWIRDVVYPKILELKEIIYNLPDQVTGGYSQTYIDDLKDELLEEIEVVKIKSEIETIEKLLLYDGSGSVFVEDINRGGNFVSKTVIEIDPDTGNLYVANGGTVFAKLGGGFWVRQYSGAVNVKWFGAKGDWNGTTGSNDSQYFKKALQFCIDNNKELHLDYSKYYISSLVDVTIPNNGVCKINGNGATIIQGGTWEQITIYATNINAETYVDIGNLNIEGVETVSATHWGSDTTATYPKNIGIGIKSKYVNINNCNMSYIWGKGLNISHSKEININNMKFKDVGGHSYTYDGAGIDPNSDDFGDCIYITYVLPDCKINISNIKGYALTTTDTSGAGAGLSRAGIVFERGYSGANNVVLRVSDCYFTGFQRTFHFENEIDINPTYYASFSSISAENTGLLWHSSIAPVYIDAFDISASFNSLASFTPPLFFIQSITRANVYNGYFTNPTKAWNENNGDVPNACVLNFYNCTFYMNDARFHSINSTYNLRDCYIYDYNDDGSNLGGVSYRYENCSFSTTTSETYNNVIGISADIFYNCNLTNQTINLDSVIQLTTYRMDSGLSTGNCIRINNATTDIPKIKQAVYEVIELDTGVTKYGYVTETGSVYAPTGAIQAGSTSDTIRTGSGLTYAVFVKILQHDTTI